MAFFLKRLSSFSLTNTLIFYGLIFSLHPSWNTDWGVSEISEVKSDLETFLAIMKVKY